MIHIYSRGRNHNGKEDNNITYQKRETSSESSIMLQCIVECSIAQTLKVVKMKPLAQKPMSLARNPSLNLSTLCITTYSR